MTYKYGFTLTYLAHFVLVWDLLTEKELEFTLFHFKVKEETQEWWDFQEDVVLKATGALLALKEILDPQVIIWMSAWPF